MSPAKKPVATRTLLCRRGGGVDRFARKGGAIESSEFKITIPATAKVTLSAGVNPAANSRGFVDTSNGPCLRIYEGTKQTACFVGIVEFRDVAYDYLEKIVEVEVEEEFDNVGNEKRRKATAVRYSEVDF